MTTTKISCWADPLTPVERRYLAAKLARACNLSRASAMVTKRTGELDLSFSLALFSVDCSELHLDATGGADA